MHPPNILLLLIHMGSVGCLYTYQKLKVKRLEDVRHHVKSVGIAPSQCNCSTPHCWECRPRSRRYGPYMLRQGCLDQMDLKKLVTLKIIVSSLKRMRKWRVMSNSSSKLTELYVHWHIIELKRTGGRYTYESQTLGPTWDVGGDSGSLTNLPCSISSMQQGTLVSMLLRWCRLPGPMKELHERCGV